MKNLNSIELRNLFKSYFVEKEHLALPSVSLIPDNDKTLFFTGAGMVPFKKYFIGELEPPSQRITTCQRCIRTNDIENVGHTSRHQTFFEMLGNFSFDDYFKENAIIYAWDFLTNILEMNPNKLYVTIYPDDNDSKNIWLKQKSFIKDHLYKLKDNFWEIGNGPCGPDSEIYYDLGYNGCDNCGITCNCGRYLEIWNLVFTQFDKQDNQYLPLKQKNIDTGAGLERLLSVLQNKTSNFETDVFSFIKSIPINDLTTKRIIADHTKAAVMLIADGVIPSNKEQGYILRKIIRRAIRYWKLYDENSQLTSLINPIITIYKDSEDFKFLIDKQDYIIKVLTREEQLFNSTLKQGLKLLNKEINNLSSNHLDGKIVFKLYDTFGFPFELTHEICSEHNITINKQEFDECLKKQRELSKQ